MKLRKTAINLLFLGVLGACASAPDSEVLPELNQAGPREIYLQEPFTRVVARCYAPLPQAVEACATLYEQKGYVRFTNIPYKVARYDFLTQDTYPTRRWRENELTPRW